MFTTLEHPLLSEGIQCFAVLRCWLLTVGIFLIPRLCCWETHCIMYSEDSAARFPLFPASPFVASYVIQCYPSLPNLHTSTLQTFTNSLLLPPTSPSLQLILCHTPSWALFYATTDLTKIMLGGSKSRNFEKLYLKLPLGARGGGMG